MTDYANQMQRMIDEGQSTQPKFGYWGMFFYHDHEQGVFLWFDDQTKFLEMAKHMCWVYLPVDGEYDADLFIRNGEIIQSYLTKQISLEDAWIALNDLLKKGISIEWWGQFDDLVSGNGLFPKEFRAGFWSNLTETDEENTQTIPADQINDFIKYTVDFL